MGNRPEWYGLLHTVCDLEDLHDMIESIQVDAHNRRLAEQRSRTSAGEDF